MPHAVSYRPLAREIAALPSGATVGDLAVVIGHSTACTLGGKMLLLGALGELAPETEWLQGLVALSAALVADNPRFDAMLWCDWCLEGRA